MRAKIEAASADDLSVHIADKSNPHGVTAEQIGAAKAEDLKSYLPLTGGAMTGAIINKNTSQGIVWSSDALELKALDTSKKTSATARIHENGVFGVELKNSADDFGGHFRVLHGNGYDGVYYNSDAARFDDDHRLAQQSYVDNAVKYRTNPNLLDNWFFGRPVNQRGQTGYTAAGYTVDRWKFSNNSGKIVLDDTGIMFTGINDYAELNQLYEFPENLRGKQYTASVLIDSFDGEGNFFLVVQNQNVWASTQLSKGLNHFTDTFWSDSTTLRFFIQSQSVNLSNPPKIHILAAKLELGSAQTLAHKEGDRWILNEIPDFGEQLRRCQRYRWRFCPAEYVGSAIAFGISANAARALIYLPEQMRTNPTLNFNKNTGLFLTGVDGDIFGMTLALVWTSPNSICVEFQKSGAFAPNSVYFVRGDGSSAIDISADL